jgi:uncharacterized repeat protein (TIGR01451 family)
MISPSSRFKYASLALLALSSVSAMHGAWAVGTAANTAINNRATVSYTVGTVAQAPIESSPGGNSTPGVGAGANTTFVVDNRVDLTVTRQDASVVTASPGQANVVATFLVTNTGNAPQAYQLTPSNIAGGTVAGLTGAGTDNQDMGNLRAFVDVNNDGSYDAGDTATSITTLAADAPGVRVFILADTPLAATNGQFASVRLTATTAVNNTPGTVQTATPLTQADTAGSVDVVFGDGAGTGDATRDGQFSADDQYAIQSATLVIAKTSTVISDPFNGTTNPKAIPGAVIEYTITLTNNGAVSATGVAIADPIPANTTFRQGDYTGTTDVRITVGTTDSFCVAENGPDSPVDGCNRSGGNLQIANPALSNVLTGPGNAVTVRFRVTIN